MGKQLRSCRRVASVVMAAAFVAGGWPLVMGAGPAAAAAGPGGLWVDSPAIEFGTLDPGSSASQTVGVHNSSTAPITGLTVGSLAAPWSRTSDCDATLAAGANCTVTITYAPTTAATHLSTLSLTAGDTTATVDMMGKGRPGAYPLVVETLGLDFGTQPTPGASAARQVVIRNQATTSTSFTLTSAATTGQFSVDPSDCVGNPKVLAAGATCHLDVTHASTSVASHTGTLTVNTNVSGPGTSSALVQLAGTGVKGIVLQTSRVDFGTVQLGSTATRSVTLKNNTGAAVSYTALGVPSTSAYAGTTTCVAPGTIPAGGTCTVSYTFTPSSTISYPAIQSISIQTPGGTFSSNLTLAGQGTTTLRVGPTSMDFGDVSIFGASTLRPVTVTNRSASTVTFATFTSATGPFSVPATTCNGTLAAGASCTYSVQFTPTGLGVASGSVRFELDYTDPASTGPNLVTLVSATGTGVFGPGLEFPVQITDRSVALGTGVVGTTSTYDVLVHNVSASTQAFALSGGTPVGNSVTVDNQCGATPTLAAGASCTLRYTFAPTTTGNLGANTSWTATVGSASRSFPISTTGVGVFPIAATAAAADFGAAWYQTAACNIGQIGCGTQPSADLTLTNTTDASVTAAFGSLAAPIDVFVQSNTCTGTMTLAAGASCTVRAQPSPRVDANGAGTANLSVTPTGATAASVPISWSYTGRFPFTIERTGHNFGTVNMGSTTTRSVSITNVSPFNQTTPSRNLPAPGNPAFSATSGCSPFGILVGQSCSVTLQLAPAATGSQSTNQTVQFGVGPAVKSWTVAELGYVRSTAAELVVTPTAVDLGPVQPGQTHAHDLTVRNIGLTDITDLTVASPSGSGLSLTGVCPTVVAGGTCTVTATATGNGSDGPASHTATLVYGGSSHPVYLIATHLPIPNEDPVAISQTVDAQRRVATPIRLEAIDPDHDPLVFTIGTAPTKGALHCDGQDCTYTSAPGETGTDAFTFDVQDGHGGVAHGSVSITLTNSAPVATPQEIDAERGQATPVTLSATDANGDDLSYVFTPPSKGDLTCLASGACSYTSHPGASGTDSFQFEAADAHGGGSLATVTIHLTNSSPVAEAAIVSAPRRQPTPLLLSASDANLDALTFTVATEPARGSLDCTGPSCTYTSAPGASGADSFTFTADDGFGGTDQATVTILLSNSAPTAEPQALSAPSHVATPITLAGDDPNEDELTFAVTTPPTKGAITCTPGGACSYRSDVGASGADAFTFEVTDGHGGIASAVVDISLSNSKPVADPQDVAAVRGASTAITLTGTDPNADPLTFIAPVQAPTKGVLACDGANCTYVAAPAATGTDTFTFRVDDGAGHTDTATVTVSLVNSAPQGQATSLIVTKGTSKAFTLTGVDPQGDPITAAMVSPPTRGTVTCSGPTGAACTYTATGSPGTETLSYTLTDQYGATSEPITIAVTVTPPRVTVGDAQIMEPEAGQGSAAVNIPIGLSAPMPTDVTISYYTVDGTAVGTNTSGDYHTWGTAAAPRTLVIKAGQTWQAVSVPVFADPLVESDEAFSVKVTAVTTADGSPIGLGDSTGVVTLLDSGNAPGDPQLLVQNTSADESDNASGQKAQFSIEFSRALPSQLTLQLAFLDGSAVQGSASSGGDWKRPASTTLVIPAGTLQCRSVDFAIWGDTLAELDETLRLQVVPPPGAALVQRQSVGTFTIRNDD